MTKEKTTDHKFDAIILGAGAAGLLCAIEAGKRGRRVVVLERADSPGKKILISGGGRCNFTNLHCGAENFLSANPHFAKSALARFSPSDFIAMVERHGIAYHEKSLGQLFCDHSANEILEMLLSECSAVGAQIVLRSNVLQIAKSQNFIVETSSGNFRAPALVVATGGLSIPKLGATSMGFDIARQFNLKIQTPRPALVPLLLKPQDRGNYCDLAGVSVGVIASTDHQAFREKMLITHRGLSGPAILQISSYWTEGKSLRIDLAPGQSIVAAIEAGKVRSTAARSNLQAILPKRLASRWLDLNPPDSWTKQGLEEIENQLHEWVLQPAGTEGYEKAEVTAGGVDTAELSSKTMECRNVPGLFFIGEVVDVTGHLGGFNFQWAWASGAAAGQAV